MSELLDLLRAEVRAIVRAEIAAMGVVQAEYSNVSLPPGATSRTFCRWCRSGRVKGAVRDGQGWRCSAAAWRESRAGARPAPPALRVVRDDAAELLAQAGFRRTR
jgi:hypothetical protein